MAQADGDAAAVFAADACLDVLQYRLGHHAFVRQLGFELEALALMPPG